MDKQKLPLVCAGKLAYDAFKATLKHFLDKGLDSRIEDHCWMNQSYEIKLPSHAFLDGRSSPWRKLRQVGCYDGAKFRLVTLDS